MSHAIRLGMKHWGAVGTDENNYLLVDTDKSQAKRIFSPITMHLHAIYTGIIVSRSIEGCTAALPI